MRLCSICDKKIEGSWCKNCHRYVKSYEIANDIRLNERHDPANDAGCTYHTETSGHRTRQATGTSHSTTTRTTAASTVKVDKSTVKKTKKKVGWVIAVIYILIMCCGKLFSSIVGGIQEFSHSVMEEFGQDEALLGEEAVEPPEEVDDLRNVTERNLALQEFTPAEIREEDSYVIKYYKPEDVKTLEYPCDDTHYAMTFSEFEKWLYDATDGACELLETEHSYGDYLFEYENELWAQFSSYQEYVLWGNSYACVDYDTVTEQVHWLEFVSETPAAEVWLYYDAVEICEPDTECSEDTFTKQFAAAMEKAEEEGSATFSPSGNVYVSVIEDEGIYLMQMMPLFE